MAHALVVAEGALSTIIYILECFYPMDPLMIPVGMLLKISAAVTSTAATATVAWDPSSSGTGGLFSMSNGTLTIEYLTIWHNGTSKGPIFAHTGGIGTFELLV
jgi:hypothetical protein